MEKPNLEKEVKHTILEPELSYKFFTMEGAILLGIAIVLISIGNTYTRYAAWPVLLCAFLVPFLKEHVFHMKVKKH